MADDDANFHAMIDLTYAQADATACRVPLTNLFDTVSATRAYGRKAGCLPRCSRLGHTRFDDGGVRLFLLF